jgi:alpha-galactosidase
MTTWSQPVPQPDLVQVQRDPYGAWTRPEAAGVAVACRPSGDGLAITVGATGELSRVTLRWRLDHPSGALLLGDAWERSYGDLAWQSSPRAEELHPWMVLRHHSSGTWGAGVEVRAGAFAGWTIDPGGVSLWLDVRAGADPVVLGDRELAAATIRWVAGDGGPFAAQCALVAALCTDPLPTGPLVGANNWYYAYGKDFDADAVVADARLVAELVGDHPVRPFGVVDDGWSIDGTADGHQSSGGPWDAGRAGSFAGMAEVAARIAAEGVRPGIWFRPLLARVEPGAGALRPWEGGWALDPSHPATVGSVAADVRRFREWGFELIKHDFSSFEALGRWGFQMGPRPAADGVHVFDRSRTTAEVLVDFYGVIHEAAGDGVVLGCNVVGHLAAGLVQAQRTGDDTSGRVWERTRRMGVNTLAFRLAQHRRFFTVDADCVASTPQTPWSKNRQFLDLIARSGTALFVSVDPATRTDAIDADLAAALRLALDGGEPEGVEPLDWLHNSTPAVWKCGSEVRVHDWYEAPGADPYDRTDSTPSAP